MIRELKEEIMRLQSLVVARGVSGGDDGDQSDGDNVTDKLLTTQKLMASMTETYEDKVVLLIVPV